jgi:peptide deformylase
VTDEKLRIVTYLPDDSERDMLTRPTEPWDFSVHSVNESIELAHEMVEYMYAARGIGLSANQLGIPYSVFVMRGYPENFACFNPSIAMSDVKMARMDEACLSFPGLVLSVERPQGGRVRFQGPNGQVTSHTYNGLTFRCFSHELAHLQGRMWFEGCRRHDLEVAIRQAKKRGFDYSGCGLMKYAKRFKDDKKK